MRISDPLSAGLKLERRRGIALVIVLALLVLVTVAIMAFFTRATANRAVEATRAGQLLAGQLATTASDYVIGTILADVPANAETSNENEIRWYQSTTPAGVLPEKRVSAAISDAAPFVNLLRQSVPSADTNASSHSTTAPAQNGRAISPASWNSPQLHFEQGFTAAASAPHWIYINRDGTAGSGPAAQAVGRFSYNTWHTSGLLDANVAGHPALTGTALAGLKTFPTGADLTALPGVTPDAATSLAGFRMQDAASGEAFAAAAQADARTGFLDPQLDVNGAIITKNIFSSRSDLIRYATLQNAPLVSALPYLTHFSTGTTAPAVQVDWDDDGVPNALPLRRPTDVTLTRYRDDGTSYTVERRAGEPLLDARFPLAKIAWLSLNGPAAGISPEAIRARFGLRWNPTERRWDYLGATGEAVRDVIASLETVAQQNRDPDFFELLYAGIGRDSMDLGMGSLWGLPGNADTALWGTRPEASSYKGASGFTEDDSAQFQVMRIGACIIDQVDDDNFPTTIHFADHNFHGVEDLPYISGIYPKVYYRESGTTSEFGDPPVSVYLIPQLWNPHRRSTAGNSPSRIRITFSGDSQWFTSLQVPDPTATNANRRKSVRSPEVPSAFSNETIEMELRTADDFRATPDIIRPGAGVTGTLGAGVQPPGLNAGDYDPAVGLQIGAYSDPWPADYRRNYYSPPPSFPMGERPILPAPPYPAGRAPNGNITTPRVHLELVNTRIELSYWDGSGWRTYATFANGNGLITPALGLPGGGFVIGTLFRNFRREPGPELIRNIDPRTNRFGLALSTQSVVGSPTGQVGVTDFATSTWQRQGNSELVAQMGFNHEGPNGFNPSAYTSGNWGFNLPIARFWTNALNDARYADRDGVFRPADGYLAASTANPMFASATGAAGASTPSDRARPIVLQRPFRSVAELGYVFRDQPWKSLDFFSGTSADAALLDLFCVNENGKSLREGAIHPLAAPLEVLTAIFKDTPYDEMDALFPSVTGSIDATAATALATEFSANGGATLDRSGFPALVAGNSLAQAARVTKASREAALRALNDMSDLHTWRLFGDVVVQSGRFATDSTAADRFLVEGEERVWLSFAIDRRTGRVIARQSEFPAP